MESVSLEMGDIFEEGMPGGDEDQLPEMLPDLPEGLESEIQGTQNDDETENKEVQAKLNKMKGASKNTVKRPIPKLDSVRLTGERGIPILPRIFKDVKLRGKGNEVEDLRVVMRYLEHWAHRLFPRMPFDEVLERIERLGTKRDVQTCIKKMRLDMPVLGSDMVSRGEDEEGVSADVEEDGTDQAADQAQPSAEDLFDALLREEREVERERDDVPTDSQRDTTSGISYSQTTPSGAASSSQPSQGLNADVLERIERNRRLAMERRAKKLGHPPPNKSLQGPPTSHSPSAESEVNEGGCSNSQPDPAGTEAASSQPSHSSQQTPVHPPDQAVADDAS